jgi:hypothetical protein
VATKTAAGFQTDGFVVVVVVVFIIATHNNYFA